MKVKKTRRRQRRENRIARLTNTGEILSSKGQKKVQKGTEGEARADKLNKKARSGKGLLSGAKYRLYKTAADVEDYFARGTMSKGFKKIRKGEKKSDRAGKIATRLANKDRRVAERKKRVAQRKRRKEIFKAIKKSGKS